MSVDHCSWLLMYGTAHTHTHTHTYTHKHTQVPRRQDKMIRSETPIDAMERCKTSQAVWGRLYMRLQEVAWASYLLRSRIYIILMQSPSPTAAASSHHLWPRDLDLPFLPVPVRIASKDCTVHRPTFLTVRYGHHCSFFVTKFTGKISWNQFTTWSYRTHK